MLINLASQYAPWLPDRLFANGQQGVWYVPQPIYRGGQVLFQDDAGTTPVTADGDPVGLMLDLSPNGNDASQSTSAARPLYRTDGVLHWLEFDGVDDRIFIPPTGISGSNNRTAIWAGGVPSLQLGGHDVGMPDGSRWTFRALNDDLRIEIEGAGYTTSFSSTATAINSCILNGTTLGDHTIYQNGASEAVIGSGLVDTRDEQNEIGRASGGFQPSVMRGLIVVSEALPDNTRERAEEYMAKLAGITL